MSHSSPHRRKDGFCCGPKGKYFHDVPPLPPLPPSFAPLLAHPDISNLSRKLNLLFSFASLETTAEFPQFRSGPPAFVAIQGRVYHRLRPTHVNSGIRWLLYDGFMKQSAPFPQIAAQLPPDWLQIVSDTLLAINPFASQLRSLSQLSAEDCPHASLILKDTGTSPEIAAVMSYENTTQAQIQPRRLVVSRLDSGNQHIPTTSRLWEPLAYPLLFPTGTLGWGTTLTDDESNMESACTTQIWHYRARLLRDERFHIFGRLTNEYLVDMFSRNLECRLNYIRRNQQRIQQEDAELMGTSAVGDLENIYLPSSFLGSNRWASEQIADSLAIAARFGPPTFFITMTCNATWPEISSQLRPGQTYADIPLVVIRVFRRKLALLEKTLRNMFPNSGGIDYMIRTVEFQKRGLPHAHILTQYASSCNTPSDIDDIISAEVPLDPDDVVLVHRFMMHNHPSVDQPPSTYCQKVDNNGTRSCRFHYPQSLQQVTTINDDGRPQYRRRKHGDEMVVPHCLPLLRKFQCHLNVEAANSSQLFQYLFKYIHKGTQSLMNLNCHPHQQFREKLTRPYKAL